MLALLSILIVSVLYASSLYSYLLFHSLVELFSIVTAFVIFVIAWHTRRIHDNRYLLFIGIASLATAAIELVHMLAYKGMGVFSGYSADLPTQLWIAFRYVFSFSFLLAPIYITRSFNALKTLGVYGIMTGALLFTIFSGLFPACFIEGTGLTPFKINSEYIISLIFLAALCLLIMNRRSFDPTVFALLTGAILASVASELSFTRYISVFGPANMLGHFFLLASMVLIYRALVITGIVEPSNLLFLDLKKSEEAIRESEMKYRSLFENMVNGFAYHRIVTDGHGKPVDYVFLEVNEAFERLTGLKRDQIVGKGVREVLPGIENDPADWIGTYGKVAFTGREVRFEQHAAPLGKWFSVSAYSPMKDYFVAIFEDITARKLAEEKIAKLNNALKQNVLGLEAANRELESFAFSVSHDLRTPLRSIDGFTDAIREEYGDQLDAKGQGYLQRVRAAVAKMGQLIDALLNLSRLTRGELNRSSVNLSALAGTIIDDLQKTGPTRAIRFNIAEGMVAEGDPVMLRAALENLLGNAWKFSSKCSSALVEFGVTTKDGEKVYFVRDNGAGFDMAYANKMFTAFQRLHTADEFPGVGIGLATVQRIIHRHGGRIWAEGEPDKGATFYFML